MLSFSRPAASFDRITSASAATGTVIPAMRCRTGAAAEVVVTAGSRRREHEVEVAGSGRERPAVGGREHVCVDRETDAFRVAGASKPRLEIDQREREPFEIVSRPLRRHVEIGGQDRRARRDRGDRSDHDVADVVSLERAQDLAGLEVGDVRRRAHAA